MDMEARSFSPERSRQLLVKVKEYKADLAKLRTDASTAAAQVCHIAIAKLPTDTLKLD